MVEEELGEVAHVLAVDAALVPVDLQSVGCSESTRSSVGERLDRSIVLHSLLVG